MIRNEEFNHTIYIDKDQCIGCSHCVRVCPTEALRVWRGKAALNEEKCVDCGDCERVCPVKAIHVRDDYNYPKDQTYRVALIPSVFWGQFAADVSRSSIYTAISNLGFSEVFEVEESVEMLSDELQKYVDQHKSEKIISSFCPAIVRLIQTRFPELVSSIAHLKSPVELSALHIQRKLKDQFKEKDDFQIFYITPCAAKAAAIKNDTEVHLITASINMNLFFNQVNAQLKIIGDKVGQEKPEQLSPKSIGWSLRGGESQFLNARSLSIDGMNHCIKFLENIDKEDFKNIDFLELKACDQGCAGGILNPQNRFLCVESLRSRAKKSKTQYIKAELLLKKGDFEIDEIEEKSVLALDSNPSKALKMMNKTRRLMCYLPGFDCGACGAPTCKALAEDVAKGDAILSHCVFMQRQMEKHHQLSPSHAFNIIETIWGKDRLDKDCNKKGAINDY
jgi:iron only hydrogenase large subunit-like protein